MNVLLCAWRSVHVNWMLTEELSFTGDVQLINFKPLISNYDVLSPVAHCVTFLCVLYVNVVKNPFEKITRLRSALLVKVFISFLIHIFSNNFIICEKYCNTITESKSCHLKQVFNFEIYFINSFSNYLFLIDYILNSNK